VVFVSARDGRVRGERGAVATYAATGPREAEAPRHALGAALVVEDDPEVRDLLAELLRRAGLATVQAESGDEAIAKARSARPALVLLDVCLPGTNGYEVCRTLRDELGDDLPIIFISGERVDALDRAAGLMLGADDYIVKPFDPDELVARVLRLVQRSSRQARPADRHGLTPRERDVLRLLAVGARPAEIARQLVISRKTVSNHMQKLFVKLGVHSQAQAVSVAFREGLLDEVRDELPSLDAPLAVVQ
jgi:DNA-binding NarL/FixJ family response regulator